MLFGELKENSSVAMLSSTCLSFFRGGGGVMVLYALCVWTLRIFTCHWNILGCPRRLSGPGHKTPNKPQGFDWGCVLPLAEWRANPALSAMQEPIPEFRVQCVMLL